jgi:hypothetical protein
MKDAEPIKKDESLGQILALMAQHIIECAFFIHDYAVKKASVC